MKNRNFLFNKFNIFLIFMLFLLTNCYLGNNPNVKMIFEIIIIIITLLILFNFIIFIIKRKKEKILILFFLFILSFFLSSYFGQYSNIITVFHIYYPIIGIILYYIMSIEYNENATIISLNNAYFILILINFITILLFPNGMYSDGYNNNWFFKYDNLHIMMFLPAFLVSLITLLKFQNNNLNKLKVYLEWSIITISILTCKSANSLICLFLIVLFYIFMKVSRKKRGVIKNANVFLHIYIALFLLIVIFRLQNIFSWVIVNVLNKNLTFSNRTIIWDKVINYIKLKPILGYGIENTEIFRAKMGNHAFTHAHNTILDILYKGGIVSLTIFFLFLKVVCKKLNKINFYYSDLIKIIFFSLLIMTIVEARQEKMGFFILFFIINSLEKLKISTDKEVNSNV